MIGGHDLSTKNATRRKTQPRQCRVIMKRCGHLPPAYTIPHIFYMDSQGMSRTFLRERGDIGRFLYLLHKKGFILDGKPEDFYVDKESTP